MKILYGLTALLLLGAVAPVHAGIASGLTEICTEWVEFSVYIDGELIYQHPEDGVVYFDGDDLYYNSSVPVVVPETPTNVFRQPDEVFDEYSGVWRNAGVGQFSAFLCEPSKIITEPVEIPEFGIIAGGALAAISLGIVAFRRR